MNAKFLGYLGNTQAIIYQCFFNLRDYIFKGATKLYLTHYSNVVNILFSAGLESLHFLPILILLES